MRIVVPLCLALGALGLGALEPGAAAPLFAPEWKLDIAPGTDAYAVTRAPAPVLPPGGGTAIRFELRPGDCNPNNRIGDCRTFRERAELRNLFEAGPGQELWYAFDLLIPVDYPEMSPAQILGQFHDGEAPVLSNRYEHGRMTFVVQTRRGAIAHKGLLPGGVLQKGRWLHLVYHAAWSRADGLLEVFADGAPVFAYRGPDLTAAELGGVYLKVGIYRSHLDRHTGGPSPVQVAYYANLRRGAARAEVEQASR